MKSVVLAVALLVIAGGLGYAFLSSDHGIEAPQSPTPPPAPKVPPPAMPPTPAHAHAAPLEAFATATVGDWHAYRVVNGGTLGEIRTTAMVAITAVTPDTVTRAMRGRIDATGEEKHEPNDAFPRKGLTLERLTGDDLAEWTLSDVTVVDEVHTVGGRAFACKKISYASADPMFPEKRTHTDLWISPEVPAGGLVEEHEIQHLDQATFEITSQVIGFGTAAGTTWGTRPPGW
ncbi:MAG: hypothetical protein K8W52_18080 [Deltaproteobacteria bacterium]|nr:hypothetical protein [Deltaproteobacteria bacterium]